MTELTPELIADLAAPIDLELSPDGRRVAYVLMPYSKAEQHGVSAIWIADVDGARPPRRFSAGTAADRQPRWSADGRKIAFLSDRATRGTAQLYLIEVDGGEATAITPAKNKRPVLSFAWSPDGSRIAFTSADEPTDEDQRREKERDDADVYGERWEYARLRLLTLADGAVATLVGGERHIAAMAWSPSGDALAYTVWQTPALDSLEREIAVERVAAAGGEPQLLCRVACYVSSLRWSSDSASLLLEAPYAQRAQSSSAIWSIPAGGGAAWRLALGETECAGGLAQPPAAGRAVARVGRGLETYLAWLNTRTGALETICSTADDEAPADIGDFAVGLADDALTVAVAGSSGDQPWELWAGQPSMLRRITDHQAALAEVRFGPQEPFRWTAPDGLELDGLLIRPPAAPAGPLPTVVLVHGGPYHRWSPGLHLRWGDWGQWLATAGYAVLMPNPRGGSGHGERFAAAARADVGGADYADIMAAVDAVVERGIADPRRLGIGGWSQGGFMSAWAVTQTRRFKAAIVGAGPTDWGWMAATSDLPTFERSLGGSVPWDGVGPHRHAQLSPLSFARDVATPVLILHGQNDARVPLNQAISFHRALRDSGATAELVVYPREPHGIAERTHQIDLLRRVRAWFARWLRQADGTEI
jgi:dipeptidyl aminopeptidase/acylaminoacyl peptidase